MRLVTFLVVLATLLLRLVISDAYSELVQSHKEARGTDGRAPLYGTDDDLRFPDVYHVVFHDGYTLQQHFLSIGMDLSNTDSDWFVPSDDGYRAKIGQNILDSHVRMDPGVMFVEADGPLDFNYGDVSTDAEVQRRYILEVERMQAPYGLQMVGAPSKLPTPVQNGGQYLSLQGAGRGVNVYVFDGGIRTSHTLFGGRASHIGGGASSDRSRYTDETNDDLWGHGTHVAGIIGAEKYGVAPSANIISVKVMGVGAGSLRFIQAMKDVIAEHRANTERDHSGAPWKFRGSIINMSMDWKGIRNRELMRKQLVRATQEGIPVFAAAGNAARGQPPRDVSRAGVYPCAYPEVVCVGAVDNNYYFANYSNYGAAVKYHAPGTDVLSLGIKSDEALASSTGTSMACPHAAGAAAIFTSWSGLLNNQAPEYVKSNSLDNLIIGVPYGTGTRLINTGIQSPEKHYYEPFRYGRLYPGANHNTHDLPDRELKLKVAVTAADVSSVPSATPFSGIDIGSYTTMQTITLSAATGLSTEAVSATLEPSTALDISSDSVPTQSATPAPPAGGEKGQQIALALNMSLHADLDVNGWKRLISYDSNKISVLLADVRNEDFRSWDDDWKQIIKAANDTGKRIIGYVDTGYLGASEQLLATRLGSIDISDWLAQIENDVDIWYTLYGGDRGLGGIYFDAGWSNCGPDNMYSDMYAHINAYTKRRHPGAFTVLNIGSNASQCLENTMDTLVTFKGSYDTYTTSYNPLDWTPADPRMIWHIIHSVPASSVNRVVELAKQRGAGLVQVTNDTLDRPFDADPIPDDAYMQSFMDAVPGGSAPVADAPTAADGPAADIPGSLVVESWGYTSVSLSWDLSANAVGYNVYLHGVQVLSIPSYMTTGTVTNIPSNTSHLSFSVRAIGGGGIESRSSEPVFVSTLALPGGRPIVNLKADPQDDFTTYSADVLVPFSSVMVFITYPTSNGNCTGQDAPAWPIRYDTSIFHCAVAMVQGESLYRYDGTVSDTATGYPTWAWAPIGAVAVTRQGYTYSWVAPMGLSTMDTTSFVVQAEGHEPAAYVFSPCPDSREWTEVDWTRPEDGTFCG